MRHPITGRLRAALLLATLSIGCTLPTQGDPEIPMVTIPNSFVAAITGDLNASLDGTATTLSASGGIPRTVELRSTAFPAMRVQVSKGILGSGSFDFAEGDYSLAGIPGFRAVDAILYLSAAVGDDFIATSGTLEIVNSGPNIIRGRFDFTGTSMSGAATRRVRVRGTFWSVPAAP